MTTRVWRLSSVFRSPHLRSDGAPVNPELIRQRDHADSLHAGCSHSVHFLLHEACSGSFFWFRRRTDQRVIGPIFGLAVLSWIP